MNDYKSLWNDLPEEERKKLMPYMISSQIQHLEQGKRKAIRSHKALLDDFNSHIKNLKSELRKYE